MSAAARYLKGCKMLERYEGKLSHTVLRRGGASNRLFLVYDPFFRVYHEFHEWANYTNFNRLFFGKPLELLRARR
uniref:Uncharacterized protein n=1 Tax=Candidatus Methanogaster sp. ANME-2c ERB4 TaxID=2759911 RepID=A0A7G9YR48_9EURY|nr:hypothetical protein EGLMOMJH_00021 [Methanosarcinales archaeon ANME-2c ERB4]